MSYKTFDINHAESSYSIDLHNMEGFVVKVKTGRWLLVDDKGNVLGSKRSETDILKVAERVEERRYNGNLHGYRFGAKVSTEVVVERAQSVHAGRFDYSNVHFDGHYWWGDIYDSETKMVAEHLRMDYHINYERLPFETSKVEKH